jgi:thiamine biosynthesis lipoprotein
MSKTPIKGLGEGQSRHTLNGETMGTRYSAIFFTPENLDADLDVDAVATALFASVDLVDRQMSTWKPQSDLMRLNAAPIKEWVNIPAELAEVLNVALEIGRASNGAFDIALGDLVNLWGFGAEGSTPQADGIAKQLGQSRAAAYELLELDLDRNRAFKLAPVHLDLSGIAKGFGVDQMLDCLKGFGIKNALVGLDGELGAIGTKEKNQPWAVAVEKPDYEARAPIGVIGLCDASVATSGDYRHWVEVGDVRLSHTMNRQTGGPLQNRLASVSVVSETCMKADAWATALMVMGEVAGPALAKGLGMDALFITREADGLHQIEVGSVFGQV